MNKVLLAGIALALGTDFASAADMPMKVPPAPLPPFSWTGCYIGGNIGAAWANSDWHDRLFGLEWDSTSNARLAGGGQVGCNYQFSNPGLVFGLEGDFDWVGHNNGGQTSVVAASSPHAGDVISLTSNDNRIATLAARFGYGGDHVLFYGKMGGAWVANNGFTVVDQTTGAAFVGNNSNTASGWMVGIGLEYALTNNWTAKVEYDFIGLPGRTVVLPGVIAPTLSGDTLTSDHNAQVIKWGVNYLFSWGGP